MAISVKQAVNAKPKSKVYYLSDGHNLRLRIRANGTKQWECRYTLDRKQQTYVLGTLDLDPVSRDTFDRTIHDQELFDLGGSQYVMGPVQARKAHLEWVVKPVKLGVDPRSGKQARVVEKSVKKAEAQAEVNATITSGTLFKDVAARWLEDHKAGWTKKYHQGSVGRVENHMNDAFGDVPINMITRPMVVKMLKKFHGSDRDSARLDVRDKTHRQLKEILAMAQIEELIDSNPADFSRKAAGLQEAKKGSALEKRAMKMLAEEFEDAWKILPEFWAQLGPDHSGMSEVIEIYIKLMILTLSRPGEARCAKWSEIDFDEKLWRVPKERMKQRRPHLVALSDQAIILLRRLQSITGEFNHLFPKMITGGFDVKFDDNASLSDNAATVAIRRLGYDCHLHGFRHMASSKLHGEEIGEEGEERGRWDSLWIEYALSHVDGNTIRGTYNKANYLKARRRMLQWYSDQICPVRRLGLVEKSA